MTNRIIKKSHFAKSKILLIILCILGLVFSYSCNCRNNSTAPVDDNPPPPKVFSISTSSVETRLVQKGSDANSLTYQPSIKFSEKNNNAFTVDYEVTDDAGTFTKANTSYDASTGLITFTDLSSLAVDKKTITIKFIVKANDTTLENPETNFTLLVDLKKTAGKLDPKAHIGELFTQVSGFSPSNFGFSVNIKNAKNTDVSASLKALDDGKNKGEVKYQKGSFTSSLIDNIKEQANTGTTKITYRSMEVLDKDGSGTTGIYSFYFKFIFSD